MDLREDGAQRLPIVLGGLPGRSERLFEELASKPALTPAFVDRDVAEQRAPTLAVPFQKGEPSE
jgi:hypothetical protein